MPSGWSPGSSQPSGSCLCSLVGCCILWRAPNCVFPFPSQKGRADFCRLEYPRAHGTLSQVPACASHPCPSGPSHCLPPLAHHPAPGGSSRIPSQMLALHPILFLHRPSGSRVPSLPLLPSILSRVTRASFSSFGSNRSQIAPLRSDCTPEVRPQKSRAGPRCRKGCGALGGEEERAALLASHPSQLTQRVAASSPQALLL